ncbi:hypothetical protein H6F61_13510 [Cyanobacteria bacterium FACHB-472]|nr:hypothetical protein [Cyanobacteria bacterium FACHB-472]
MLTGSAIFMLCLAVFQIYGQFSDKWVGVNQDTLKVGLYKTEGTMNANSYRKVASSGEKLCVEIADGPAIPYAGLVEINVSSLSLLNGNFYIDATGELIKTGKGEPQWDTGKTDYFKFDENDMEWHLISSDIGNAARLAECLLKSEE